MRLHLGEVFLEIAIVIASLAILINRSLFRYMAMISGVAGVVTAATELLVK